MRAPALATLAIMLFGATAPRSLGASAVQCPDGSPPPCAGESVRPRVQVMTFEAPAGDTTAAYLASVLWDDVVSAPRSSGSVVVLGPRGAPGAGYRLQAQLRGAEGGVALSARLEQGGSGQVAWSTRRNLLPRDLAEVAPQLATEVLGAMGVHRAAVRPVGRGADPRVAELITRGRYQFLRRTVSGVGRATELFRSAVAIDSTSSLAWAWLARTLLYANRWGFAVPGIPADSMLAHELAAADRAVELDPTSAVAWFARGLVAQDVAPDRRAESVAGLRRAVALDPGLADAWQLLAAALMEAGEMAAAMAPAVRAVALAPDDGGYLNWVALANYWQRDFATARRWADSAAAVDPTLGVPRGVSAVIAFWSGRTSDAEAHAAAHQRLTQGPEGIEWSWVRVALPAARGDTAEARRALASLVERAGPRPSGHGALSVAQAHVALGDYAAAMSVLTGFRLPGDCHFQLHLRHEPGFDPLRGNDAFRRLVATGETCRL